MRHTQFGASFRALKERTRALVLALAALLLIALASVGGCTQTAPPVTRGNNQQQQPVCPALQQQCTSPQGVAACIDPKTNSNNCGACNTACPAGGGLCLNGGCQCLPGLQACAAAGTLPAACANLASDGNHCGICTTVCAAGTFCGNGICGATCPAGTMACGTSCVNTMQDASNCGACGNACPPGLGCSLGQCACPSGQTNCPGLGCISTMTDSSNCGACGTVCQNSTVCTAGTCQCPAGVTCGPPGAGGAAGSANAGGAGGTSGGGGSGGSGGSGGCVMTGVENGGFIAQGSWHGYGFTAAINGLRTDMTPTTGSVIVPADFGQFTNFPLCASGTVSNSYNSLAMIGWNLQQEINDECGEDNPKLTVTPTLAGINLNIRNTGGSPLRVQLQAPEGSLEGSAGEEYRWCATVSGSGFIPFEAFKLRCWSGGMNQTLYAKQPIDTIIIMVPGDEAATQTFNFCVDGLIETNDMGPPPGIGCALNANQGASMTYNLTNDQTANVNRDGRNYVVQNNVWNAAANKAAQTVSGQGTAFTVAAQGNSQPTTGAPASFPSVFIGSNNGHASTNSGLPIQVSNIADVQTGWRIQGVSGETNASYDVWFNTSNSQTNTPTGGYLMVWFHDPPAAQPLGTPVGTEVVAGKSWQVWTCGSGCQNGVPVISYVPNGAVSEMSFDLMDFIQNAVDKYPSNVSASWWLTNVFAGFEAWSGGQGSRTNDFCAVVIPK